MSDFDASQLREILVEFIVESREHVDAFERSMLTLEREPGNRDAMAEGFRAMHSIKGNASFLALAPFEALTHAGETVLGRVRAGELGERISPVVDALLGFIDLLRHMLDLLERGEGIEQIDVRSQVAALERWARAGSGEGEDTQQHEAPPQTDASGAGELGLESSDDEHGLRGTASTGKIRVDVALLDRLMNLVGELVLARNQVLQHTSDGGLGALGPTAQRLDHVTAQLQEAVMKTRMQPVGLAWTRFPRVVRDLCQELGKQARVVMEGGETELDKRIIEALNDPLIHLLRNAVDHGIEDPAQRRAAGKPSHATILVRAFHEGGLVNIEISDDGAGVDLELVRARGAALGLTQALGPEPSQAQLLGLLFEPGFSTRSEVTTLSGRGIGLDVVRTNIEQLGGAIDLNSRRGEGTVVRIKMPLTLAIIPALIVTSAGERFALPQANLLEIVRVSVGAAGQRGAGGPRIDDVQGAPVLSLRGQLLPLVDLAAVLDLREGAGGDPCETASVVLLSAEDRRYGLLVDAVHDTEEIVVKPLWAGLGSISSYAGATILGDGQVALILDALGLAQHARLLGEGERLRSRSSPQADRTASEHGRASELLLLCRAHDGGQLAVPVAEVARLEEVELADIERIGAVEVIRHNSEIVPLVRLEALRGEQAGVDGREHASVQVILHRIDGRLAGLVVEQLLDIVEVEVELQRPTMRVGMRGSMVIRDKITEFVDLSAAVRLGVPGFLADAHTQASEPRA